jgi:hypothetical protein
MKEENVINLCGFEGDFDDSSRNSVKDQGRGNVGYLVQGNSVDRLHKKFG